MNPYSKGLRLRVLAATDWHNPRGEIVRPLGWLSGDRKALRETQKGERRTGA
jgi:hypothetical protein